MVWKIKKYFKQLTNPGTLGLHIFVVLAILVTWSGVKVIQTNYELQKKIAQLQQKIDIQKLENENLRLRNKYFETNHYLELTARRNFNKGAAGEKLLLVPKETALKHTVELPKLNTKNAPVSKASNADKPFYQRNLEAWRDYFLHTN